MLGDTSQDGNWSCFRNELFNKEETYITTERFIPMPTSGKVEFDFSILDRPDHENTGMDVVVCIINNMTTIINSLFIPYYADPDDLLPLPDNKFVRVLASFEIIHENDRTECEEILEQWNKVCIYVYNCVLMCKTYK
jgi:hypothetical protein